MTDGALGEIRLYAGPLIPDQWQACKGQLLSVADYPELYAVIGNAFGGTPGTTFALPLLSPPKTDFFAYPGVQYMICTVGTYPSAGGLEGTIGEIRIFAGSTAPQNWAFCDGSLLSISQNELLYYVVGTNYGGDGAQTFALPLLDNLVGVRYMICTEGAFPALASEISCSPVETIVGEIRLWPGNFGGGPAGFFILTYPSSLSISDYVDLYSIIGCEYGGDNITYFYLPQLTPVPAQPGSPGASYVCSFNGIFPRFP